MAAVNLDLVVEQGTTYDLQVTIIDDDGEKVDLTGHLFESQIRKTYTAEEIIATFTVIPEDQEDEDTLGVLRMVLDPEDTNDIVLLPVFAPGQPTTQFCYDLLSTKEGKKYRWLQGLVNISPAITRDEE